MLRHFVKATPRTRPATWSARGSAPCTRPRQKSGDHSPRRWVHRPRCCAPEGLPCPTFEIAARQLQCSATHTLDFRLAFERGFIRWPIRNLLPPFLSVRSANGLGLIATCSKVVSDLVASHRVEPAAKTVARRSTLKLFQLGRERMKDFLHHIRCVVWLQTGSTSPTVDNRTVDSHQSIPCRRIRKLRPANKALGALGVGADRGVARGIVW